MESKTTAELDALNLCRYEASAIDDILALWWNLYTVEITATFGGGSAQTRTSEAARKGAGAIPGDIILDDEATPVSRVCASYDESPGVGTTFLSEYASPYVHNTTEDAWAIITLRRVYYNSTTSKYALTFSIEVDGGAYGTMLRGDNSLATANGGTITIFGSTTYAGTKPSGGGYVDISLTIASPTYYTY